MKSKFLSVPVVVAIMMAGLIAQGAQAATLETVNAVDLSQYAGQWYEIVRYPNSFEKNCYNATATYSANADGSIQVVNRCINASNGKTETAMGLATIADKATHAKLHVSFLPSWLRWTGLGEGNYWVIQLGDHYEYSVVSEPSRKYLWILSRTPEIDENTFNQILSKLVTQGFDTSKLETSQVGKK
jgi:apolipoprotein D and lipocalin family protein